MGFPSPAQDYVEERISLDKRIISRPAATYFMRSVATHYREDTIHGALSGVAHSGWLSRTSSNDDAFW